MVDRGRSVGSGIEDQQNLLLSINDSKLYNHTVATKTGISVTHSPYSCPQPRFMRGLLGRKGLHELLNMGFTTLSAGSLFKSVAKTWLSEIRELRLGQSKKPFMEVLQRCIICLTS